MERIGRGQAIQFGAWFFLINSILTILIAVRFMKHFGHVEGVWAWVYLSFTTIGHFVTLTFLPYFALFVPLALLLPRKTVLTVGAALIVTAGHAVLGIDTFVFDLYRFHINSFTLELVFGGAGTDIFSFHYWQYGIVISSITILLIFEIIVFTKLLKWYNNRKFRGGGWIISAVVLMLLGSHAMHAYAEAVCYRPITRVSRCYPLYVPTTASRFLYKHGIVTPNQERIALDDSFVNERGGVVYPLHPIEADTVVHMNILLILLDSWNYRAMDSLVTPHIARFAQSGLDFRNHYSGSNGTRTGVFSIFYGIPGLLWYDILGAKVGPIIIDHLIDCSYQLGIFTSASLISPPFDRTVFVRVNIDGHQGRGGTAHERDIQITEKWLNFVDQHSQSSAKQPFFGFLFYDAMHSISHPDSYRGPFQPELKYAPYEKLSNDMDPTPFWNLYRNVAHFQDSLLSMVLSDLERRGILDQTIVVITGDHGQEFNENRKGYWGHNGNYSQAQLGVPLIIHWPGMKPAVFNHWTSHYDIVPTLMQELFQCTNQTGDYSIGRNLFESSPRKWLIVGSHDNFGVIEEDRITTVYFDRSYDITDRYLNEIPDAKLNTALIDSILRLTNSYYR